MTKEELELMLKKKKCIFELTENGSYKFDNFFLRLNGDVVTYYSTDVPSGYELNDDHVSGVLNMKWGECQYAKAFVVLGFIHPGRHDEARQYLKEENMAQYFCEEDPLHIIEDMRWDMQRQQSGLIICTCKASWPKWYFGPMSDYCNGQNSDGLGEGFEQQSFISMRRDGTPTIASDESNWFKY